MGSVIPLKKSANSAYLELKNLLGKRLDKVESVIEYKLKSNVNLIEKMSGHHLKSGGKRLRALLTLGSAKVSGYELGSRDDDGSITVPPNSVGRHVEMYNYLAVQPIVANNYDNLSKFCNFLSGDPN